MTAIERLVAALDQHGSKVTGSGRQWKAQCPAHEDRTPSLSITTIEGQALVYCHAGCATPDVLASLQLSMGDLFDDPAGARYAYTDRAGTPTRYVHRTPDKAFRQSGDTRSRPQLYRLPAVTAAVAAGTPVYLVEGEKDVHALETLGAVATTSPMGAGNFGKVDASPLAGAHVVVVPDQDEEGRRYLGDALAVLDALAASVKVLRPATGKDAADHVAAGHGLDELVRDDEHEADMAIEVGLAFNRAVSDEAHRLRVRDAAGQLVRQEKLGEHPAPDGGTLAELLARPVEIRWRVDGLLASHGRMLWSAIRKAGKTTGTGNLARSLLTGEPFLGRFDVEKLDGRVVALNYEVTGEQYAAWMDDIGVPHHGLYVVNLRGRRNLLADEDGRAVLVDLIRAQEGQVLIVDPFGRAYTGKSQNDTAEVTPWLTRLDEVAEAAGISEVILTAHAGWEGERTRGSSALEDWPDSIVTMTRDTDTDQRFIKAEGRDVDVPEDRLDYDPATRRLSLSGAGNRKQVRATEHVATLAGAVRDIVTASPGINTTLLTEAMREQGLHLQREDTAAAVRVAVDSGWIFRQAGPRNSKLHFPGQSSRVVPESSPGQVVSSPDPSYKDGTTTRTTQDPSSPDVRDDWDLLAEEDAGLVETSTS